MSLPNLSSTIPASPSSFAIGPSSATPVDSSATPVDSSATPVGSSRAASFVDRRNSVGTPSAASERRQFGSSHAGLSGDGRELALAIDQYKVQHHRRYLTCDEMLSVLANLGYAKQS